MLLAILLDLFVVSKGQGAYGDYASAPDYVPPTDDYTESSGGGVYTDYDHKHECRSGFIQQWFGDQYDLPYGWQLCDGTNGTPDLVNRFPVGAGDYFKFKTIGGNKKIKISIEQMPKHNHDLKDIKVSKAGEHTHKATGNILPGGKHNHDKGTLATKSAGKHDHTWSVKTKDGKHGHNFDLQTSTDGTHYHDLNFDVRIAGNHKHGHDIKIDKGGEHKHDIKVNLYGVADYYETVECGDIKVSNPDHIHGVGTYATNDHVFKHGHKFNGKTSDDGLHIHGIDAESTPNGKHSHDFKLKTDGAGAHNHGHGDLTTNKAGEHKHGIKERTTSTDGEHIHETKAYYESSGDYSDELVDISLDKVDGKTGRPSRTSTDGVHTHIVPECVTDNCGNHEHLIEGNTATCNDHIHGIIGEIAECGDHTHRYKCESQADGAHKHTVTGKTDDITVTLSHKMTGDSGPAGGFDITRTPKCSIDSGEHSHYSEGECAIGGEHDHTISGKIYDDGQHIHTIDAETDDSGAHSHGVTGTVGGDGDHTHNIEGKTSKVPDHVHDITGQTGDCGDHTHDVTITISKEGDHTHDLTGSTHHVGGGKPIEIMPPYYALHYICCIGGDGGYVPEESITYPESPEEPEYVPPARY